ncbi:unnamed protein product [Diamesa serratosioi]
MCPSPLEFSITDSTCTTKELANCKVCPPTGISRVADTSACDKFILCNKGVEIPKQCDAGDHFNSKSNECDTPANAKCLIDPCTSSSDEAPFVPDVMFPNCTNYLECADKKTVGATIACPTNFKFDVSKQMCSSKFVC